MSIQRPELDALAAQLPDLHFIAEQDSGWPKTGLAQAYLDYYHLNFAKQLPGITHGFGALDAAGFRIACHYWLPENPRGSLLIVHGYYDHTGIFDKAIAFALQANLAVLAFDLPGHGLSSGEPAVIDSFNQYADVLAVLLQKSRKLMPLPLHALGQSTGCAVLLNYLWRYADQGDPFAKIALCAPLIVPRGWRGWAPGQYLYALLHRWMSKLKRGPANSSHDQAFNHFIMHRDPLQAKYLSLRWVGAMKAWHQMFCQFTPLPRPLLIVQGTGDMTVDWRYNLPLLQRKLPAARLLMLEQAKHQLVNESESYRQRLFAALGDYFFND